MKNIVISPWKYSEEKDLYEREMDFVMKIENIPFGNPTTRVHSSQTYKKTEGKLEIARLSQSLDVPYGMTFKLEEKWILCNVENNPNKISFKYRTLFLFFKY